MRLYHGSSWWSVSDEFAEYLLGKFEWIKVQFAMMTAYYYNTQYVYVGEY